MDKECDSSEELAVSYYTSCNRCALRIVVMVEKGRFSQNRRQLTTCGYVVRVLDSL